MASGITPLGGRQSPVEHAFLPYIEEADQHDSDVHHHLPEAKHLQFAQDDCPGVKENSFHVEQYKKHGHQVELDGESSLSVADGLNSALIRRNLGAIRLVLAHQP